MPSPIGHSLAACAAYQGTVGTEPALSAWRALLLYCTAACAPDFDFLLGFLYGEPSRFHQGVSHSLGAALLFGAVVALLSWRMRGQIAWRLVLVLFSLYCSHLVFDYLAVDTGLPYGIPIWWPLSGKHYLSPIAIFSDVHRGDSPEKFIPGIFIQHNLRAVMLEILIFMPIIGLATAARRWHEWRLNLVRTAHSQNRDN